jgi:uncharacterized membrane protein
MHFSIHYTIENYVWIKTLSFYPIANLFLIRLKCSIIYAQIANVPLLFVVLDEV